MAGLWRSMRRSRAATANGIAYLRRRRPAPGRASGRCAGFAATLVDVYVNVNLRATGAFETKPTAGATCKFCWYRAMSFLIVPRLFAPGERA
jgi:hypothetical protein